jgi:predicted adenylyl cyclase CyaB
LLERFREGMKEVEVKILEVDHQKLIKTLTDLKAIKVFDGEVSTLFLDKANNEIQKKKDVLRLRKENDKVELTYKKVYANKQVKEAEEYTVQVNDLEMMLKILQTLRLSVTQKLQKHRLSYKLGDVRFDIDQYINQLDFIPEFLEIEGPIEDIKKYAKVLGFQEKDCLPWSTGDLINHYSDKRKK